MKLLLAALAVLAIAAASPRGCTLFRDPAHDAETGAGIGGFIAGPVGSKVGAAALVIIGLIVRAIEKPRVERRLERQHAEDREKLRDHYETKLERIATTQRTARSDDALTRNTPQQEPPQS